MPRILRLIDDSDTAWQTAEGHCDKAPIEHPFAPFEVTEVVARRMASDIRRWVDLAARAKLVHADGPAAVRAGYLLSQITRLARRLPFTPVRNGGRTGRLKLLATGVNRTGFGLVDRLTRHALRRADSVVATTQADAARYVDLGVSADRLTVIPPGIPAVPRYPDPIEFRRSLDIPENSRLVIAAGRFDTDAELRSAVWAFDIVRYTTRDTYLILVGDGPQRDRTERFAKGLAFDDYRVRFVSLRSDYPALFGLAEVVWVTHIRDGVDFALTGMAAGKPVVAFRTPDLVEVIEDGVTGKLVAVKDRVEFAAATCELLADPTLANRLGTAGQAHVAGRYSLSRMIDQYAVLYERMVGM